MSETDSIMNNILNSDPKRTVHIESFREQFDSFLQDSLGSGPAWLLPMRKEAFARFERLGFPTRNDEEWRFTDIRPITEQPFTRHAPHNAVTKERVAQAPLGGVDCPTLVFINGRYAPEFSNRSHLPAGVLVDSLANVLRTRPELLQPNRERQSDYANAPFAALNTAFLEDGAVVIVPPHTVIEEPIHLRFLSSALVQPSVSHPRTLVVLGEGSQATILESYAGIKVDADSADEVYFTNAVTEFFLGQSAFLDHYKLNRESARAYHIATTQIELARDTNFTSHSITLGGSIVRNDINAGLRDSGIECTLNGLYIGRDRQLIDNHTSIDHAMPHCNSHEIYKGILNDRAKGVFNGKIFVRQDAQKTDAKQTNQTLLLSADAQINTKPQLEIFADDVKCTHGATIGQLSAEALFYLRTRGIGLDEARNLLTYAFANDIVSRIKVAPVREELERALLTQLPTSK